MPISAKEAAAALKQYQQVFPMAVVRGLRKGLRKTEASIKRDFMQRKSNLHPKTWDPPNPPPGPIAIRNGDLVRSVYIIVTASTTVIKGAVGAGNSRVRYARIHELGGPINISTPGGSVFNSFIPARPYLQPAIDKTLPEVQDAIQKEMQLLARATLKGLIKVK